ncbi:MAG: SipW-dependent-type signal peptide-containing protein [Chloroflexi bacterium]|nr:SipW-dependent-type signal peptide-containing protein [Chloroflexota bacterium]
MLGMGMKILGMASPRVLLALTLSTGLLTTQAGRGTLAYFTSSASSSDNQIIAGTLLVSVADADQAPTGSVSQSLYGVNFAPGSTLPGFLDVWNQGSLELRYSMTTQDLTNAGFPANVALDDNLHVAVGALPILVPTDPMPVCGPTYGFGQQEVIPPSANMLLKNLVIGNPAQGGQPGDRTILPTLGERLCIYASLPLGDGSGVDNLMQAGATTFTFTVNAEQVINNP